MKYIVTHYNYPEKTRKEIKAHHDANNKTRQKFNSIQTKCSKSKKIHELQP